MNNGQLGAHARLEGAVIVAVSKLWGIQALFDIPVHDNPRRFDQKIGGIGSILADIISALEAAIEDSSECVREPPR